MSKPDIFSRTRFHSIFLLDDVSLYLQCVILFFFVQVHTYTYIKLVNFTEPAEIYMCISVANMPQLFPTKTWKIIHILTNNVIIYKINDYDLQEILIYGWLGLYATL